MKPIETRITHNNKYKLSKYGDGNWFLFTNDKKGRIVEVYDSLEQAELSMDADIEEYEK